MHEAALKVCGNFRPLVHAAGTGTIVELCAIVKKYGCPLVIRGENLETLEALAKKAVAAGVEELIFDLAAPTPGAYIARAITVRRSAVERTAPGLGYPLYLDVTAYDPADAAFIAGVLRYAGVIVTKPLTDAGLRAAETLRQNIYTDPQKPIQVTPGLYQVNKPGPDAPVLLTVNFSLTFFTLQGYLEASKVPCWLLIVDTEGLSVLTAVAGGKLTEDLIAKSIKESGIEAKVNHHRLIIPGYAAPISGKTEDATGWKVLVGPRDAAEIGEYLEEEWSGS
jgi:acetyl-CoA decarbonylase/synthase complex subunit gamma